MKRRTCDGSSVRRCGTEAGSMDGSPDSSPQPSEPPNTTPGKKARGFVFLAVEERSGSWGSPGCAGKRMPDFSERSGYSLIPHGSPTGNHGQAAPPKGAFHTGSV